MTPLLEITNLNVRFDTADGTVELAPEIARRL